MAKEKEKWFSWGWLIVWILIANWLGAVIYLLYKDGQRTK